MQMTNAPIEALQTLHEEVSVLRGEVFRLRKDAERYLATVLGEVAAERERYAQLCILVAAQLCEMYGDGAECIATGDACAAAIRGAADTSEPGLT